VPNQFTHTFSNILQYIDIFLRIKLNVVFFILVSLLSLHKYICSETSPVYTKYKSEHRPYKLLLWLGVWGLTVCILFWKKLHLKLVGSISSWGESSFECLLSKLFLMIASHPAQPLLLWRVHKGSITSTEPIKSHFPTI